MSCSRLLNPKTQRLQFLPPRIPKRVNQLNLSIFARRVSPNRGASCPLTRQKLGKSDTDNQSHWASPASCPNLFIAAELYISQLYIWKQLYTLGNYTHWATIHIGQLYIGALDCWKPAFWQKVLQISATHQQPEAETKPDFISWKIFASTRDRGWTGGKIQKGKFCQHYFRHKLKSFETIAHSEVLFIVEIIQIRSHSRGHKLWPSLMM